MTYDYSSPFTDNAGFLTPSLADVCNASTVVVFMSLLEYLALYNDKISEIQRRVKPVEETDDEYDFVVIGGGAAGSVVASRLSEVPKWKTLLMEEGLDEPVIGQIPSFSSTLIGTGVDWNYSTTNESGACLSIGKSCQWPSGRVLGGTTSINAMTYMRGNPKDYDMWAELGNEGWTWKEVKRYFLKAEDNAEIEKLGRIHHATGGPLPVETVRYMPPFASSILAAAEQVGYGVSADLNGETITGFTIAQLTTKNGVRRSSAAAYLRPVRDRKNLHISLSSMGTRVIIKDKRAVGVEFYKNGQLKTVRVKKEVVVSGGTVRSPQILLLSGIGPAQDLKSMGIEVVKDLPGVGENVHDHIAATLTFSLNDTDTYENDYDVAARYLDHQRGPLAGSGLIYATAILASNETSPDYPDIQIYFRGYGPGCAPGEIGALRSKEQRTVVVRAVYLHAQSRGRITLASKDPLQSPVIWGNYLSEQNDIDGMFRTVNIALALADTEALRAHNFTLADTPLEVCSDHTFLSYEYWACAIRQNQISEYHYGGSCKMGPASDPMAVVDPQLRVYGIKGLRVADASIFPQPISANTGAAAMMTGERAADFIKQDWMRWTDQLSSGHGSRSSCYSR